MFRFSIRDVLCLTVVVAMGTGWFVDHSDMTQRVAAWKMNAMTPRGPLWVNFELCGVVRRVQRGQSLTITVTEDGGITYNEPPPKPPRGHSMRFTPRELLLVTGAAAG